jgi:phosphatidylglycerophosphate synthase
LKLLPTVLSYLSFIIIIAVPPLVLPYIGYGNLLTPKFWLLFFFLSGLTFLTVIAILMVAKINKEMYAQAFLAATTVKLLACMFFALIFLLKNKVNRYVFVADFFYIYFLNMGFEIYGLLRNLRNQKIR